VDIATINGTTSIVEGRKVLTNDFWILWACNMHFYPNDPYKIGVVAFV
jgi:hypothetical protein